MGCALFVHSFTFLRQTFEPQGSSAKPLNAFTKRQYSEAKGALVQGCSEASALASIFDALGVRTLL